MWLKKILPNPAVKIFEEGNKHFRAKRFLEAIKCYQEAITKDEKYPNAYYGVALSHSEMGNEIDALAYYEKAISLNPNYMEAYNGIANSLSSLKRIDEAIKYFDKAISLDKKCVYYPYNKALTLFESDRFYEAIECLDDLIKIDSNFAPAHFLMGRILVKMKNVKALEFLRRAIRLDRQYIEKIENDPDFDFVRVMYEYQSMIE